MALQKYTEHEAIRVRTKTSARHSLCSVHLYSKESQTGGYPEISDFCWTTDGTIVRLVRYYFIDCFLLLRSSDGHERPDD